jgi:hypothetical protein
MPVSSTIVRHLFCFAFCKTDNFTKHIEILLSSLFNPEITLRNSQLYTLPNPRIELLKKSPLHSLPKTWNDLNETIRLQHNKTTFSIALKQYLLEQIILEQNT